MFLYTSLLHFPRSRTHAYAFKTHTSHVARSLACFATPLSPFALDSYKHRYVCVRVLGNDSTTVASSEDDNDDDDDEENNEKGKMRGRIVTKK